MSEMKYCERCRKRRGWPAQKTKRVEIGRCDVCGRCELLHGIPPRSLADHVDLSVEPTPRPLPAPKPWKADGMRRKRKAERDKARAKAS